MTLKSRVLALAACAAIASTSFFTGCDDTLTTPGTFTPSAPTNLMALALNDSTIRIKWTASADESNASFKQYEITAVSGASKSFTANKGVTMMDLTGLTAGSQWTITVKSSSTSSTMSATGASVISATARRYSSLKMYERSSALGSGIELTTGKNWNASSGGAAYWDLCFDSDQDAVGTPSLSKYATGGKIGTVQARTTMMFLNKDTTLYYTFADSINAVYENKAINDTTTTRKLKGQYLFDVATSGTQGFVFYALTDNMNFAKVRVKLVGGKYIQSDANGKFVELEASVQQTANIPYALKQNFPGWDSPGIVVNKIYHVN